MAKSRECSPFRNISIVAGHATLPDYICLTPPATVSTTSCSARPASSCISSHLSAPFTTQRSIRSFQTKDQFIYAAVEDLADWFSQLYADLRAPIQIDAENFLSLLSSGEILCRHANYIELWVKNVDLVHDLSALTLAHLRSPIAYKLNAQPGSFHARDNVCKFILWCREKRIDERGVIFETEDLVSRKNTNNVIYCLLDVARYVGRNCQDRVPLPGLIMLERDIEIEEREQQIHDGDDDAGSIRSDTNRFTPASTSGEGGVCPRIVGSASPASISLGLVSPFTDAGTSSLHSPAGSGGIEDEVSTSSGSSSRAADIESANDAAYAGDGKHESRNNSTDAVRLNLSGSFTSPASNNSGKRNNSAAVRRRRTLADDDDNASTSSQRRTTLLQRNIDALVQDTVRTCSCSEPLRAEKISAGKFLIGRGAMTMTIYVRVLRYHIMVRVGGGWTTLSEFLEKHDPCRLHHNSLPASDVHAFLRSDSNFSPSTTTTTLPAADNRSPRTTAQKVSSSARNNASGSQATTSGNSPPVTLNTSGLDSGLSGCESPSSSIVLIGNASDQPQQRGNVVLSSVAAQEDDAVSSSVDSNKRHSRASSTTSTSFASESSSNSSCLFGLVPSSSIALTTTPSSTTIVARNAQSKNCLTSPISSNNLKKNNRQCSPATTTRTLPRRSLSSSRSVIVAAAAAAAAAAAIQSTRPQTSQRGVLRTPSTIAAPHSNIHRPRTACAGGLMTSLTAENIVRRPMTSAAMRGRNTNVNTVRLSLPAKSIGASRRLQPEKPFSREISVETCSGDTFQTANAQVVESAKSSHSVLHAYSQATAFLGQQQAEQRYLSLLRAPTPVKFPSSSSSAIVIAQSDNSVIQNSNTNF